MCSFYTQFERLPELQRNVYITTTNNHLHYVQSVLECWKGTDRTVGESELLSVGVWIPWPCPPINLYVGVAQFKGFQGVSGPRPSQETLLLIVPHAQVRPAPGGHLLCKLTALDWVGNLMTPLIESCLWSCGSKGLEGSYWPLNQTHVYALNLNIPKGIGGGKSTPPSVFSGATVGRLLEADPRFPSSCCKGLKMIRLAIRSGG